jgi:hypothetical protein
MSRNTATVIIEGGDDNRDRGKTFFLTEFPPRKSHAWAIRALTAVARSGATVMDDTMVQAVKDSGMAAMAALGLRAVTSIAYEDAMSLLDELLEAVMFVPDPSKIDKSTMHPFSRPLNDSDIDEISTIALLHDEVFKLHTGFSVAAYLSMLGLAAKERLSLLNTPTSPESSET